MDDELRGDSGARNVTAVIPAWNESTWLRKLLPLVLRLPEIAEVVVADNGSSDDTAIVARELGCRVTTGGRPATARNQGASEASCDYILFLDADTVIPGESLTSALKLFLLDPDLCAAVFHVEAIGADKFAHFGYAVANVYFRTLSRLGIVQGLGNAILVRAKPFWHVNGFDERVEVGEDVDLLRRMSRIGKGAVRYLSEVCVGTSTRRFKKENKAVFSLKVVVWTIVRLVGASWTPIAYGWDGYPGEWARADARNAVIYLRDKERSGGQGFAG